jgi:hypothetical protein
VGFWVDLNMINRITALLLFIGLAWGQADLDKLVLKDGTTHFGDLVSYSTKTVIFVSGGVQYSRPISMVARLVLEDGRVLIKNILSLEEYQKLSTKEKAIYDANLYDLKHWAHYGPISTIIFWGCTHLYLEDGKKWWDSSPNFLRGSSAASLTIPYFVLNRKEKFNFPKSIMTDSEKEIYKKAYSNRLTGRKIIYAVGSTIGTGAIVGIFALIFRNGPNGLDFGGGGSNWGMGGYSGP